MWRVWQQQAHVRGCPAPAAPCAAATRRHCWGPSLSLCSAVAPNRKVDLRGKRPRPCATLSNQVATQVLVDPPDLQRGVAPPTCALLRLLKMSRCPSCEAAQARSARPPWHHSRADAGGTRPLFPRAMSARWRVRVHHAQPGMLGAAVLTILSALAEGAPELALFLSGTLPCFAIVHVLEGSALRF